MEERSEFARLGSLRETMKNDSLTDHASVWEKLNSIAGIFGFLVALAALILALRVNSFTRREVERLRAIDVFVDVAPDESSLVTLRSVPPDRAMTFGAPESVYGTLGFNCWVKVENRSERRVSIVDISVTAPFVSVESSVFGGLRRLTWGSIRRLRDRTSGADSIYKPISLEGGDAVWKPEHVEWPLSRNAVLAVRSVLKSVPPPKLANLVSKLGLRMLWMRIDSSSSTPSFFTWKEEEPLLRCDVMTSLGTHHYTTTAPGFSNWHAAGQESRVGWKKGVESVRTSVV